MQDPHFTHREFDGHLYHATSCERAEAILREGFNPGTYLAIGELADYYATTVEDDDDTPIILKIEAAKLKTFALAPDMPGLEEPITSIVGLDEDAVWEGWQASDQTWSDCFGLIGSLKCLDRIPAELITVD